MRARSWYLFVGSLVVLAIVFMSDPSVGLITQLPFGSGTLGLIVNLVISVWFVVFLHLSRKWLFDYIDLEEFFKKSMESSEGAGMALISVALSTIAIALVVIAAVK